jgi:hypothetical protein
MWYLVKSKATGVPAAAKQVDADTWEYLTIDGKQGQMSTAQVGKHMERIPDPETGQLIKGPDPYELMRANDQKLGLSAAAADAEARGGVAAATPAEPEDSDGFDDEGNYVGEPDDDITDENPAAENPNKSPREKKSGIIKTPSDEQMRTDERFGGILASGEQSHTVLDADPGSGKTAMLNHLAWKYNAEDTGQKWLYLVFNTKNGVEARQKFPEHPGMDIMTTNVFLGNLLSEHGNADRIPQTRRIAQVLGSGKKEANPPEKMDFLADGPEFVGMMERQWHVMGADYEQNVRDGVYARDASGRPAFKEGKPMIQTLWGLLRGYNSIPAKFKKYATGLANLGKAYALDPRQGDLKPQLAEICKKHRGSVDVNFEEIKEPLRKKNAFWLEQIQDNLYDLLGYDFMRKDFTEELCEAAEWLLGQSLPYATQQTHEHKGRERDLGELRDFSDDAWFAITYADELVWPKYDVVMADECQDFNQARIVMLKKLHEAGARIVAVGDEKQSLYRFIGADDSLKKINELLTGLSADQDVHQSLSLNFRSRQAVLDLVEQECGVKLNYGRIPKDESDTWEGASSNGEIGFDDSFNGIVEERAQGQLKETAYIARTNAPLIHTALGLLKAGVPFVIIGRDVAGELMAHINRFIEKEAIVDKELLGMGKGTAKVKLTPNNPSILPEELSGVQMEARQRRGGEAMVLEDVSLYKLLGIFLESEEKRVGHLKTKADYLGGIQQTTEAMMSAIVSCAQEMGQPTTIRQSSQVLQWILIRRTKMPPPPTMKNTNSRWRKISQLCW